MREGGSRLCFVRDPDGYRIELIEMRNAVRAARPPWRVESERQTAVIDLGSNSFRLVVFTASANGWWKRTDEIYEPVRVGAGLDAAGELQPEPMERALETIELYAHFCRATGIEARGRAGRGDQRDPRRAQPRGVPRARRKVAGHPIRILSTEEEARYGYLAAVNSTTLADGVVLDLGGGSLQLVEVEGRGLVKSGSWPLGAVRMTERFLPGEEPATKKQLKALRAHVARSSRTRGLARRRPAHRRASAARCGTSPPRRRSAQELPSFGVQGFMLERDALDELIDELAGRPPAERGQVPGIKPERGDVILAGAAVIAAVLDAGGFDAIEVTEAGLREGVFFGAYLAPADPPLFEDVREASVRNLAAQYPADPPHVEHVAKLALQMFDALAAAGVHAGDPLERELLWAAAMLHDIGMAVDYDDHHKHSRYLILNAGLPGFRPREVALIAQMARYHRKGSPTLGELAPLMRKGDDELLARCSALLRLAEQLERSPRPARSRDERLGPQRSRRAGPDRGGRHQRRPLGAPAPGGALPGRHSAAG